MADVDNEKDHVDCGAHPRDLVHFRDGSWIYCMRRPFLFNCLVATPIVVLAGALEGWSFVQCGIGRSPEVMTQQMGFNVNIVLRLFAAAIGGSCLFQGLMDIVVPTFFDETRGSRYSRPSKLRLVLGSALVGVGIAGGAGATMSPTMLGAGVGSAPASIAGFLAAAACFYILDAKLGLIPKNPEVNEFSKRKLVLDEQLKIPYWKLAIPLGAAMLGGMKLLEMHVPFFTKNDDQVAREIGPLLMSPVTAGLVIGFGQLVMRIMAHHGQGGSSAPSTILSALTLGRISPGAFPWDGTEFSLLFQTAFVYVGTTLGGYLAMKAHPEFRATEGPAFGRAFLAGFCAVFGGKLAGGCACGKSITGAAELSPDGFLAGAVTFGTGIAFSLVMGW